MSMHNHPALRLIHSLALATAISSMTHIAHGEESENAGHLCQPSQAQAFQVKTNIPVGITLRGDFTRIMDRAIESDRPELTRTEMDMTIQLPDHQPLQARVTVQARGGSRFEDCHFRPLKLEISKEEEARLGQLVPAHFFAGLMRDIRLTPQCHSTQKAENALIKEYLVYKAFALLQSTTPAASLSHINLIHQSAPIAANGPITELGANDHVLLAGYGLLIEPFGRLAARCQLARESEHAMRRWNQDERSFQWQILRTPENIPQQDPQRRDYLRDQSNWQPYIAKAQPINLAQFEILNRLIDNGDFIVNQRHNVKALVSPHPSRPEPDQQGAYIVNAYFVPFDFDISGAVRGGVLDFNGTAKEAAEKFLAWLSANSANDDHKRLVLESLSQQKLQIFAMIADSALDAQGKNELNDWFKQHFKAIEVYLSQS